MDISEILESSSSDDEECPAEEHEEEKEKEAKKEEEELVGQRCGLFVCLFVCFLVKIIPLCFCSGAFVFV
jgi:hypothetical protein